MVGRMDRGGISGGVGEVGVAATEFLLNIEGLDAWAGNLLAAAFCTRGGLGDAPPSAELQRALELEFFFVRVCKR